MAGAIAVFTQSRLLNKMGQRTVTHIRVSLFTKMEQLPIKYFDNLVDTIAV
jgi:ATP-binding cassette subfamily B protein